MGAEAVVDLLVVGAVDGAGEVGVAVVGVFGGNIGAGLEDAERCEIGSVGGGGAGDNAGGGIPVAGGGIETSLEICVESGESPVLDEDGVGAEVQEGRAG